MLQPNFNWTKTHNFPVFSPLEPHKYSVKLAHLSPREENANILDILCQLSFPSLEMNSFPWKVSISLWPGFCVFSLSLRKNLCWNFFSEEALYCLSSWSERVISKEPFVESSFWLQKELCKNIHFSTLVINKF